MAQPDNDFGDRFLTVEQLTAKTGMARQTIYNKVSAGELPAFRLGRLLRFRLSDIEKWLEENLQPVEKAGSA